MKLNKIKLPKNASTYVLVVFNTLLLIAVFAVATFAWIPNTVRRTKTLTYDNTIVISSLDIDVNVGVYDSELDDYITIGSYLNGVSSSFADGFNFKLNPGDKMSYKVDITNTSETSVLTCDITFEDFYAVYDPDVHPDNAGDIFDYLALHIVSPYTNDFDQLSLGFSTSYTNKKNLVFTEDLTLEPGENISVIWYFELSSEASNEFWGTKVGFKSIFFGI